MVSSIIRYLWVKQVFGQTSIDQTTIQLDKYQFKQVPIQTSVWSNKYSVKQISGQTSISPNQYLAKPVSCQTSIWKKQVPG